MIHNPDQTRQQRWEKARRLLESERRSDVWEGGIATLALFDVETQSLRHFEDGVGAEVAEYFAADNTWVGRRLAEIVGMRILPICADAAASSPQPNHHRHLLTLGNPRRMARLFELDDTSYVIHQNLAINPHCSGAIRRTLAKLNTAPGHLLSNPQTEPDIIEQILDSDGGHGWASEAAAHPNTPLDRLRRFTGWSRSSERDHVEDGLHANPNIDWTIKVALNTGIAATLFAALNWNDEQQQLCLDLTDSGWMGSFSELVAIVEDMSTPAK